MQLTMRKPCKQASVGGGKDTMKRPQRGLGVAELERIRLQEEQEERLLYHAASHHLKQQPADSIHYNLHYQQVPFFSNHLSCNPNFSKPNPNLMNSNPNFLHPNPNSNGEAPATCNLSFIHAPPTKPSLSPSAAAQPLACPTLLASLATTKPTLISTHSTYPIEHSDFLLPYAITAQNSPFANTATGFIANPTANPNVAPFHNTNPNLKIPSINSAPNATPIPSPSSVMEHSFLPLHSSSFHAADDSTQPSLTFHATAADGGFCCTLEAPLYHDHFMYLATSPSVENPPSFTDSSLDSPLSKKNIPTLALQDPEEMELPSFQNMVFKAQQQKSIPTLALQVPEEMELPSFQNMVFKSQQQSMSCAYEKQYMRCNFDLNNNQGEYELACNPIRSPRTKIVSSGGTSAFGVDTSARDDFLKLGLPTITEEWNQGSMPTLEHFPAHTMSARMELPYGQMVKGNKINLDLELKLSLPSFGYQ